VRIVGFKCDYGSKVVQFLKLVKIAIVMVVGSVKDKMTFPIINFMK
jgi:hypothetical protein